jgi:hypothetical protein
MRRGLDVFRDQILWRALHVEDAAQVCVAVSSKPGPTVLPAPAEVEPPPG